MKTLYSVLLSAVAAAALAGCAGTMRTAAPVPQAMPGGSAIATGKTEVLWLGQASVRITTPGGKVMTLLSYAKAKVKGERIEGGENEVVDL